MSELAIDVLIGLGLLAGIVAIVAVWFALIGAGPETPPGHDPEDR